jgi:hypothetical protein
MARLPGRRAVLALAVLVLAPACRDKSAESNADERAKAAATLEPAGSPPGAPGSGDDASDLVGDASARFRDAEPRADVDPDGPVDPACSGAEISFNTAVVDKRCAIGSARAKQLRAALEHGDASVLPLRQEAKMVEGGRLTLRLVNEGHAPITLPLSFSAKLPAFTVLAEDDRHALYELEAPAFDVGSAATNDRPHFARIMLAPGGAAVANLTVRPGVVRALGLRPGADAAAPSRLGKGRYVLHVGELLTDVEAGDPARATWDLP